MGGADIIKPSHSPYGPYDDTPRFFFDYRKLNDVIIKDAIAIPRIDMALNNLHEAKYFTTLSLAVGYFQVSLNEESKPKTSSLQNYQ